MKIKSLNFTIYGASQILFLLGVFFKQFYLSSSGGFQLGDFFFMSSFLTLILFHNRCSILITKNDRLIIAFVSCVVIINTIYMLIYGDNYPGEFRFYKSTLYYLYNLFIIFCFRQFCNNKLFLSKLKKTFQLCLIIQLLISVANLGRFGSMRYMGTFNDPNQCGFFVFASFIIIFVISIMMKEDFPLIWYIISFYLINRTLSTGMLLGMTALLAAYIFLKFLEFDRRSAMIFLVIICGFLFFSFLFGLGILQLPESVVQSPMYRRVLSKLWSFGIGSNLTGSSIINNLMIDRCWDRLFEYPEQLLYGAGEGYYHRFPSARFTNNEIHSSIFGPLFYYGILPCSIWFLWIMRELKDIERYLWVAYIALLVESITLVNNRQPFFWIILILAGSQLAKSKILKNKVPYKNLMKSDN